MIDAQKAIYKKDDQGNLEKDEDGNLVVSLRPQDIEMIVTDFKSGVTKMFNIYEYNHTYLGATTAGIAKLNNKPIATHAKDFKEKIEARKHPLKNTKPITKEFLKHFRKLYEETMRQTNLPEQYWPSLEFLVGGIGKEDSFPSLFRVDVKNNEIIEEFSEGDTGIAWAGQSEAVERLLKGADRNFIGRIYHELEEYHDKIQKRTIEVINEILDFYELSFPENVNTDFPSPPDVSSIPIGDPGIDVANLPGQDGVYLASFLVNTQAGKDKFTRGPATVGGRVHIGVVSKSRDMGFEMLNEPELHHQFTGFSDEQ